MAKRKNGQDVHGILLVDKRLGVSSNQALQEVRRLLNANKAGHTGSLDPLATGLLPCCFGEATKVSGLMLEQDKRYLVSVKLGVMTDTGDSEGRIIDEQPVPELTVQSVRACLQGFLGEIEQVPPMYSALKHQGKKLYELARAGKTVERPARRIRVYELDLLELGAESLILEVACSKGSYIRTLAEDIGRKLNTCATLAALRRTASGPFNIAEALTIEQLRALSPQQLLERLVAMDAPLADLPAVNLSEAQSVSVRQGQQICWSADTAGIVRIYRQNTFLGLGELLLNGKLAPRKMFNLGEMH